MRLGVVGAIFTCGLALAATACGGGTTPGGAAPATTGSSAPALPYGGAPNVESPLDGTPLVNDQCSAMTPAEAEQTLGGTVQKTTPNLGTVAGSGAGETGCQWALNDGLGGVIAGPTVNNPYGLSGTYAANHDAIASGQSPIYKELPAVEGYPTIQSTEGYEGNGKCITFTGLSNSQEYVVKVQLSEDNPNYADPCGLGEKVAALAIDKLKGV